MCYIRFVTIPYHKNIYYKIEWKKYYIVEMHFSRLTKLYTP